MPKDPGYGNSTAGGGGGGGTGESTFGTLTNAEILALVGVSENSTADSSDDNIRYTFISGAWRSTGGGLLV